VLGRGELVGLYPEFLGYREEEPIVLDRVHSVTCVEADECLLRQRSTAVGTARSTRRRSAKPSRLAWLPLPAPLSSELEDTKSGKL